MYGISSEPMKPRVLVALLARVLGVGRRLRVVAEDEEERAVAEILGDLRRGVAADAHDAAGRRDERALGGVRVGRRQDEDLEPVVDELLRRRRRQGLVALVVLGDDLDRHRVAGLGQLLRGVLHALEQRRVVRGVRALQGAGEADAQRHGLDRRLLRGARLRRCARLAAGAGLGRRARRGGRADSAGALASGAADDAAGAAAELSPVLSSSSPHAAAPTESSATAAAAASLHRPLMILPLLRSGPRPVPARPGRPRRRRRRDTRR